MRRFAGVMLVMLLILASSVDAQSRRSRQKGWTMQPGFKLGLTLSNFTGGDRDYLDTGPRVSVAFGGFLKASSGSFAIQPEIWYMQKGATIAGGDETLGLNYLEIPVLFKFHSPFSTKTTDRMLYFGPAFSFLMSSTISGYGESVDIENGKGMDIALVFGGDVSWKMGKTAVFLLDVRFDWSLGQAYDDPDYANLNGWYIHAPFDVFAAPELNNLSFTMSVGVGF